jgi:alpha-galactosidase
MSSQINVGPFEVKTEGQAGAFCVALASREIEPKRYEVTLKVEADAPAVPPPVKLAFSFPCVDVQAIWRPGWGRDRGMSFNFSSHATVNMPVGTLYSQSGRNRLTIACSDAMNPVGLRAQLAEISGNFECWVEFFAVPPAALQRYEARVLLDTRDIPYEQSLGDVTKMWAAQPGYTPSPVPETARLPMYSTWYSFHQELVVDDVVRQCRLAKEMGCEAVIVDDGWQTLDTRGGYAYTGDWKPERIPDMRGFVDQVHEAGMKFLLWYGVPQVGINSKLYPQYKDKCIFYHRRHQCGYLDPRYPDVREHLIGLYTRHLREWDLDGFKLDYVDRLEWAHPGTETPKKPAPGRDMESIPEAADRLLSDIMTRLRAIKPDVIIEFRQAYVGPLMRKYGNMFRAGDCPNDALTNRLRTIDLRLTSGNTPPHGDMLMWHVDEPVESAALQLLNVMFAVPQISVLIDKIPADHQEMLRFYLKFWRDHRDALLDGSLRALHPELGYPAVIGQSAAKRVAAAYADAVVPLDANALETHIINATRTGRVVIEHAGPIAGKLVVHDCRGKLVSRRTLSWAPGVHTLAIPPSGVATIMA